MDHWLGIDASTQSVSALLVDEKGAIIAKDSVNFGSDLPDYKAPQGFLESSTPGEVHADPLMWLDALDLCLSRIVAAGVDFSNVRGISGAGQQHGTVYLNEKWPNCLLQLDSEKSLADRIKPALSRSTSPIWMDVSTEMECSEISKALGGDIEVCNRSGSVPIERFSGPQIRKFFKEDSSAYKETFRIHLVSSFLASILAGKDGPIDYGDGAGMNLLNLADLGWDAELCDATAPDLVEKLPPCTASQTILGTISPYFEKKYGFPSTAKIVAFTGDNPSSLIGMGAGSPGKIVISLGTSDTFFAAMPSVRTDPNGFGHVFGNPFGGFMSLICFRNGSLAREKVKEQLGVDWSAFDEEGLEKTPSGNDGNGMIPFFGPEITPRGDFQEPILFGSKEFKQNPSQEQLVRACLEGQFMNMRVQTKWLGVESEVILLTGGASENNGIAQTLADIMGTAVDRLGTSSSVAIGATLRAAEAINQSSTRMQQSLCSPISGSRRQPRNETRNAYNLLSKAFKAALQGQKSPLPPKSSEE